MASNNDTGATGAPEGSSERPVVAWNMPSEDRTFFKGLKVYNSLTKTKEDFVPKDGNRVNWYICGPTVYDSAHLGHARSYLSFDIIRRILEDYFGYDVYAVMNITDVDDKIILRGRQRHLFKNYVEAHPVLDGSVASDLAEAIAHYDFDTRLADAAALEDKVEMEARVKLLETTRAQTEAVVAALAADSDSAPSGDAAARLLGDAQTVLSSWLDAQHGASVTDNAIFEALSRHYEGEYLEDMEALGVRAPHVMTRVSEYVPEIVAYTQQIIDNGYGYESNGSVYFDTEAFMAAGHQYRKLKPQHKNNAADLQALREGEGALAGATTSEKKTPNDFALWKASKAGEPAWASPWGQGRPGWHIECSAMASSLLGEHLDFHGGGEDLCFPHHDNELAQAEAYYNHHQWVSYFLHAGHLHIEGAKMSKSLKNFITIRQALENNTARQIRLLFLTHSWEGGLDYSQHAMAAMEGVDRRFREFFKHIESLMREEKSPSAVAQKWHALETQLHADLVAHENAVDAAIKDSFNTPLAMQELLDLIRVANIYIRDAEARALAAPEAGGPVTLLLKKVGGYVARILTVFGVIDNTTVTRASGFGYSSAFGDAGAGAAGADAVPADVVHNILEVLSEYRDAIRTIAKANEPNTPSLLLTLSDELRDMILPEHGVRLEDRESGRAIIKLDDRDTLIAERDERIRVREQRKAQKEARRLAQAKKEEERAAKARVNPATMFTGLTDLYSAFDDIGIPTHNAEGEPLPKARVKKLKKQYQKQLKAYEKQMKLDKQAAQAE